MWGPSRGIPRVRACQGLFTPAMELRPEVITWDLISLPVKRRGGSGLTPVRFFYNKIIQKWKMQGWISTKRVGRMWNGSKKKTLNCKIFQYCPRSPREQFLDLDRVCELWSSLVELKGVYRFIWLTEFWRLPPPQSVDVTNKQEAV